MRDSNPTRPNIRLPGDARLHYRISHKRANAPQYLGGQALDSFRSGKVAFYHVGVIDAIWPCRGVRAVTDDKTPISDLRT